MYNYTRDRLIDWWLCFVVLVCLCKRKQNSQVCVMFSSLFSTRCDPHQRRGGNRLTYEAMYILQRAIPSFVVITVVSWPSILNLAENMP